jgi:hypothetical protein
MFVSVRVEVDREKYNKLKNQYIKRATRKGETK